MRRSSLLVLLAAFLVAGWLALSGCADKPGSGLSGGGETGAPSGGPGGGTTAGGGSGGGGGSGPGSSTASAYIYVSSAANNSISGFAAASDGTLTAIAGSPFAAQDIGPIAGNAKYVFGVENDESLVSFAMGSAGALTQAFAVDARQKNPSGAGGPVSVFLDRAGVTLYDNSIDAENTNNQYQSFGIEQNGALTFLGITSQYNPQDAQLSFTSDDQFAFGSDCLGGVAQIYGYRRNGSGALTAVDPSANYPTPPLGSIGYCPGGAAVAGNSSVVIAMQIPEARGSNLGATQLAVYSIDETNGILTTTNTSTNMLTTPVGQETLSDYRFDPAGDTLAVAGSGGVQLYTFVDGGLTPMGNVLVQDAVDQVGWDSTGHLYALSRSEGNLYVFTVANGTATAVAGSPYAVPGATWLSVQPAS